MAKRFIETSFYKSPFVRSLKGSLKSLYSFIICDCDGSGIWNYDLQAASMYIGFEVTDSEFEEHFIKKNKAINLKNGRFFFPDFIEHQYPGGLNVNNPAQKNFITELQKNSMIDGDLKPLWGGCQASNVMVMETGNGNGIGKSNSKKPKKEILIPSENEFLEYCKENLGERYFPLEFSLKSKYKSWLANNWKDGYDKKIKNWKTKILNVVPHLKPEKNTNGVESSKGGEQSTSKSATTISNANTILERRGIDPNKFLQKPTGRRT